MTTLSNEALISLWVSTSILGLRKVFLDDKMLHEMLKRGDGLAEGEEKITSCSFASTAGGGGNSYLLDKEDNISLVFRGTVRREAGDAVSMIGLTVTIEGEHFGYIARYMLPVEMNSILSGSPFRQEAAIGMIRLTVAKALADPDFASRTMQNLTTFFTTPKDKMPD